MLRDFLPRLFGVLSASAVAQEDLPRLEGRTVSIAADTAALRGILDVADERGEGYVQLFLCLFAGEAGLEPAKDIQPVVVPAVHAIPVRTHARRHRQRDKDLRTFHVGGAVESFRRHAGDGHRRAIDDERVVKHGGVSAELSRPVVVGQHGDIMHAWRAIVIEREEAAEQPA